MSAVVEDVRAAYGRHEVLSGIDLSIARGEVVVVLGPSGSGKTTLLRVIAGLHPPTGGRILIDGDDLTRVPAQRRGVGLVPQEGALFPQRTTAANIGYGIRGLRSRRAVDDPRVRELIELVGLSGLEDRMPHELSGGQQQRIALARALAPRPRLVLLDEPFNSLDADLRGRVREAVIGVLRTAEVGALLITHDRAEAMSLADRIAVLHDGRILQEGTPHELYVSPRSQRVARVTGDVIMLEGSVAGDIAETAVGRIPVTGTGEVVMLRPDQLLIVDAGERDDVVVVRSISEGPSVRVEVRAGPTHLTVPAGRFDALPTPGTRVGIAVRGSGLLLPRE